MAILLFQLHQLLLIICQWYTWISNLDVFDSNICRGNDYFWQDRHMLVDVFGEQVIRVMAIYRSFRRSFSAESSSIVGGIALLLP